MWTAVLLGSFGCYALKLAGLSVPPRVLENPRIRRIAELLPIALLSALIGTQTFADGRSLCGAAPRSSSSSSGPPPLPPSSASQPDPFRPAGVKSPI